MTMKTIQRIAVLAAFLTSGSALAQAPATAPQRPAGPGGSVGQGRHGFGKRFDRDGDGKITVAELPPHVREKLAGADTNKDGVISPSEMKAHHEKMEEQWFADADANKDGKLTLQEIRAHREKMKAEHFARIDTNRDGVVTEQEVGAEKWAHLVRADANGDKKVTRAELEQAMFSGKMHGMHGGPGGGHGDHQPPPF